MNGESVKAETNNAVDPRWFELDEQTVEPRAEAPEPGAGLEKPGLSDAERLKRAQSYLKNHRRELNVFSGDSSLAYRTSAEADTFTFYPKTNTVEMPVKWFDEGAYTEYELNFSNYHELSHFADMRKNPEAYLGNFSYMRTRANTLAEKYLTEHPGRAKEAVERFYYKELHTLYNCLDDVYVNNLVRARASVYHSTEIGKATVESLYKKLGFGESDLTKQPKHRQLAYALLRDEMVGDTLGKSVVAPEVEAVFGQKLLGRDLRTVLYEKLRPLDGVRLDPAERYNFIQKRVEPAYLQLLDESMKETPEPPKPPEGEDGEFEPFGSNNPDPELPNTLDEETIKDILKKCEEKDKLDKNGEGGRTDIEAARAKEKFDKKFDIKPEEREEYEAIAEEIQKPRQEMRKFWNSLIGKSIEFERRTQHEQRRGRLNVRSLILDYPAFFDATRTGKLDELKIYDREKLEQVTVAKPDLIDISLLVDGSTSMTWQRMQAARRAAELLMLSVKDFNNSLEQTRQETKSELRADTEVVMFGSDFQTIKEFERDKGSKQNSADIIKSISQMASNWGSTDDAAPLLQIHERLTEDEKRRIKERKYLKVVFEITDGVPDSSSATRRAVQELQKDGVLVFAFQIGDVTEDDRKTFNDIWNPEGQKQAGVYVGENINKLPGELMRTLSGLMEGIRL